MESYKDIIITSTEGDFKLSMGKGLTSFYYKGLERFVFRAAELDVFCEMVKKTKEQLDAAYKENEKA